ncbi:hypothetical protein Q0N36_08250 [Corynebacterium kefirresidentii]|uniref:Uncharacterized protein n=1 Tax=Corynebacterium kefirresidentii TaxID=1979527 RepID=A0ABT8Q6S7_9CORY|nr:hypothetical protein [Corynebacterium kefirresidentii]MDN8620572.1 hypothetical protein [Corynebacterium kefirresidentii]MDN8642018.1 hypothetical protein [Corynebacterium kefirresidentii]
MLHANATQEMALARLRQLGWFDSPFEDLFTLDTGDSQLYELVDNSFGYGDKALSLADCHVIEGQVWAPSERMESNHDEALDFLNPRDAFSLWVFMLRAGIPKQPFSCAPIVRHEWFAVPLSLCPSGYENSLIDNLADLIVAGEIEWLRIADPLVMLALLSRGFDPAKILNGGEVAPLAEMYRESTLELWAAEYFRRHGVATSPVSRIRRVGHADCRVLPEISDSLFFFRESELMASSLNHARRAFQEMSTPESRTFLRETFPETRSAELTKTIHTHCAASKSNEVKESAEFLIDVLGIQDEEVDKWSAELTPALFRKNPHLAKLCLIHYVETIEEGKLAELVLQGMLFNSRALKVATCRALAKRSLSTQTQKECLSAVDIAGEADDHPQLHAEIEKLRSAWEIDQSTDANYGESGPLTWIAAPQLWKIASYSPAGTSAERLTQLAAKIVRRDLDDGLLFDKLYAETLELASHNIKEARLALVGASEPIAHYGLEGTYQFSRGEDIGVRRTPQGMVFQRAGKVSRLLSTPDRVDGTVSYSLLEARIDEFKKAGIALDLYDLKAAVRRLRDDTPELLRKLLHNATPVVPANASANDAEYFVPLAEELGEERIEKLCKWTEACSLERDKQIVTHWPEHAFINMEDPNEVHDLRPGTFDFEPEARESKWWVPQWPSERLWLLASQAKPLGPARAMELLTEPVFAHPDNLENCWNALDAAWRRGLLIPGTPRARSSRWALSGIRIGAQATFLESLAEEGKLSLVWPLLLNYAKFVAEKAEETNRLPSGSLEILRALHKLAPNVPAEELNISDFTGVRAIADRPGAARTVTLARTLLQDVEPVAK